jgi:hypothetical protein
MATSTNTPPDLRSDLLSPPSIFPIPMSAPPPGSGLLTFHCEPRYTVVFCRKCNSIVTDKRQGNRHLMECLRFPFPQRSRLVKYIQTLEPPILFDRDLFKPRQNGCASLPFLPTPKPGFVCLHPGCTFITANQAVKKGHHRSRFQIEMRINLNAAPRADRNA